jgi:hypothetical protein
MRYRRYCPCATIVVDSITPFQIVLSRTMSGFLYNGGKQDSPTALCRAKLLKTCICRVRGARVANCRAECEGQNRGPSLASVRLHSKDVDHWIIWRLMQRKPLCLLGDAGSKVAQQKWD